MFSFIADCVRDSFVGLLLFWMTGRRAFAPQEDDTIVLINQVNGFDSGQRGSKQLNNYRNSKLLAHARAGLEELANRGGDDLMLDPHNWSLTKRILVAGVICFYT